MIEDLILIEFCKFYKRVENSRLSIIRYYRKNQETTSLVTKNFRKFWNRIDLIEKKRDWEIRNKPKRQIQRTKLYQRKRFAFKQFEIFWYFINGETIISKTKEYRRQKNKEYFQNHPEKRREYYKKYYKTEKGKATLLRNKKRWLEKNPDWCKNYQRLYSQRTGYIHQKRSYRKQKLMVLTHYGGSPPHCSCCGESDIGFLTLDHIFNNGSKITKADPSHRQPYAWVVKHKFPPAFQVLCYNCNMARAKNNGICPHKTKIESQVQVLRN